MINKGVINNNLTRGNKKEIVGWDMPDYNSAISLSQSSFPYTATQKGIVRINGTGNNSDFGIYVNGVMLHQQQVQSLYSGRSAYVIVDVDDIVSYVASAFVSAIFIPLKVEIND